jgi:hypothetical protein
MNFFEIQDERKAQVAEYNALKKMLGGLLLEQHSAEEVSPEDIAYYTRKFNEARERLGGKNAPQIVRRLRG